jgi:hypothetical protein
MGEAKQRKLLAEKSGDNTGGRKPPPPPTSAIAQELKRRIDSGEPIKQTRDWFLKQDKVWNSYFADQEPFVQSFILDLTTDFMIFLERDEHPDKPLTEIVLERLAYLRQNHPELAKSTIDRLMKGIEPKPAPRTWAKGAFTVFANGVECFSWTGTKQDAIDVQKYCLETTGALGIPPDRYAAQAASYLIAYGLPAAGDADRRPSGLSDLQWSAGEALCFKHAILRAALRERASDVAGQDAGQRIEDMFAGRRFEIRFKGDQASHRASMARAQQYAQQQRGGVKPSGSVESSGNDNNDANVDKGDSTRTTIRTTELKEPCLLDPQDAVCIPYLDLLALAGRQIDPPTRDSIPETLPEVVYVPRIPIDAAEAEAMLRMTTTVAVTVRTGATDPDPATDPAPRTYAGYTNEELKFCRL